MRKQRRVEPEKRRIGNICLWLAHHRQVKRTDALLLRCFCEIVIISANIWSANFSYRFPNILPVSFHKENKYSSTEAFNLIGLNCTQMYILKSVATVMA